MVDSFWHSSSNRRIWHESVSADNVTSLIWSRFHTHSHVVKPCHQHKDTEVRLTFKNKQGNFILVDSSYVRQCNDEWLLCKRLKKSDKFGGDSLRMFLCRDIHLVTWQSKCYCVEEYNWTTCCSFFESISFPWTYFYKTIPLSNC